MISEYILAHHPIKLFGFVLFWRTRYVPTTNTLMARLLAKDEL